MTSGTAKIQRKLIIKNKCSLNISNLYLIIQQILCDNFFIKRINLIL
jgi:hypothetical protein